MTLHGVQRNYRRRKLDVELIKASINSGIVGFNQWWVCTSVAEIEVMAHSKIAGDSHREEQGNVLWLCLCRNVTLDLNPNLSSNLSIVPVLICTVVWYQASVLICIVVWYQASGSQVVKLRSEGKGRSWVLFDFLSSKQNGCDSGLFFRSWDLFSRLLNWLSSTSPQAHFI